MTILPGCERVPTNMGLSNRAVQKREMGLRETRMELSTYAKILKISSSGSASMVELVHFVMPLESNMGDTSHHWANFTAVLFPSDQLKEAMGFWRDTGSGLSTRHAEFSLEELDYLDSDSATVLAYRTPAPRKRSRNKTPQSLPWMRAATASVHELKSFIAYIATSEQPGQPAVSPNDVFLYPNGMNAIYSLSEALTSPDSKAVMYGTNSNQILLDGYIRKQSKPSDELEDMLLCGQRIQALFCELPSNITLASPNLHRIRALADKHNFIVACDDTVAGYINLDAIPYVDIMISSLTKAFSGASNVTGGYLVINPDSRHYDAIRAALSSKCQNTYFPLDVDIIRQNCKTIVGRVKQCNRNTLPLVDLFKAHPAIAEVNHPSIAPTSVLYKSVMRKGGGYGNVLSIVFHDPRMAEHFYNVVNICEGSSFGTNFTLAIPYVQLANLWNQDKVAKYGVPRHIIRISVWLGDAEQIVDTFARALKSVDEFDSKNSK
ncbi:hypothetical protein BBP40_009754 [Aspergillus hancockii]|nr:hypothetical protein BBP40_009754 [Aspergillus hancockii]